LCVILALETQKELESLTLEQLKNAEAMNPDGNGYATLINGKVVFEKGISIDDIWTKIKNKEIVSPCIIHCRITSVGKTVPELCHPFVVNEDSRNYMNGTLKDSETALFHNGTFSEYKDLVLQVAMGAGRHLPSGNMSDTRGLAFVLQTLGIEALEYIDTGFNKFATLNAKDGLKKFGSWVKVNGIESSNNYYQNSTPQFTYGNFPQNDYFQYDEFNDEDTLYYNKQALENKSLDEYNYQKASENGTKKPTKKEHKMNIDYLKKHGWKSFSNYTKREIQKIVNSMQTQNKLVKEIDKRKKEHFKKFGVKFEDTYTIEDYEDVLNYQKFEHDGTT